MRLTIWIQMAMALTAFALTIRLFILSWRTSARFHEMRKNGVLQIMSTTNVAVGGVALIVILALSGSGTIALMLHPTYSEDEVPLALVQRFAIAVACAGCAAIALVLTVARNMAIKADRKIRSTDLPRTETDVPRS